MESFFVSGKNLDGNWELVSEEATVLTLWRKEKSVGESIRDLPDPPQKKHNISQLAFVQSSTIYKALSYMLCQMDILFPFEA